MFNILMIVSFTLTMLVWACSLAHTLIYICDKTTPKPWPLAAHRTETRAIKAIKVWAYFPTLFCKSVWDMFTASEKGSSFIKWMNEKI